MVVRILHAPATALVTTRQAGVAIWASWAISENLSFIVLTVGAYVRETYVL